MLTISNDEVALSNRDVSLLGPQRDAEVLVRTNGSDNNVTNLLVASLTLTGVELNDALAPPLTTM